MAAGGGIADLGEDHGVPPCVPAVPDLVVNVLPYGGTGFMGSRLAKKLRAGGKDSICISANGRKY